MTEAFTFRGAAARLGPGDVAAAAARIGVPAENLLAVVHVETSGSGYDAEGRPSILFEPAQFYAHLQGAAQTRAAEEGLAARSWGEVPYAPTSDGNYDRLRRAMLIDETAALCSCSWGLGQVMGSNYPMAGCASVQAMVAEACASEAGQLRQMCSFLVRSGAARLLAASEWAAFARSYNGPGYAKNHYDAKLAAYARAASDIAASAAPPAPPPAAPEPPPPAAPAGGPVTAEELNAAELAATAGDQPPG